MCLTAGNRISSAQIYSHACNVASKQKQKDRNIRSGSMNKNGYAKLFCSSSAAEARRCGARGCLVNEGRQSNRGDPMLLALVKCIVL